MSSTESKSPRQPTPIELVRPSFYRMLVVYYSIVVAYGILRSLFLSTALAEQQGRDYALVWGYVVAGASIVAMLGVFLTRVKHTGWIEWGAAIVLIAALGGYGYSSIVYGITGSPANASAAIPNAAVAIALCVLPGWRILVMAADGTVIFRRVKATSARILNTSRDWEVR